MTPASDNERKLLVTAQMASDFFIGMKKSGLYVVFPEVDQAVEDRLRSLIRFLSFQDNNGGLPEGVSEEFMQNVVSQVGARLVSNNLMLPTELRRSRSV